MGQILMGQLVKLTGISRETLRYYEKSGLIPPPLRNQSGYRVYPENTLERVEFIFRAKEAGFTLVEIAATLALADESQKLDPQDFKGCIEKKITQVKKRISELELMLIELEKIREAMDKESYCSLIKKIVG